MQVTVEKIPFLSISYFQSLDVRYRVLREPLGLTFQPADLQADENSELFVAKIENKVVGTLILSSVSQNAFKMRQVAVLPEYANLGIGKMMVEESEMFAKKALIPVIELNARQTAIPFYEKLDYRVVSEEFYEVNIPHKKMKKELLS